MNKTNKKVIFTVVGIIVAVGLFWGGVVFGETHPKMYLNTSGQTLGNGAAFGGNFAGRGGVGTPSRGGANGGLFSGQILSKDSQSITVSVQGGGSKIVFLSASTSIMKTTSGTQDDLQSGSNVTVIGSANSDGSLTAQSIQIRPQGSMPFGGPGSNRGGQ